MKAAVYLGPGKMEIQKMPVPRIEEDEVLLKVKACAICGTDVRIYSFGQKNVRPPHIIGHEVAGAISEVGKRIKSYQRGERVILMTSVGCGRCEMCLQGRPNLCPENRAIGYYYSGGFAQYMKVPGEAVRQGNILPIPDELSFVDATLAEPLSCCINGQEYLNIGVGDTVVVVGTGPIGCMHAELARISGATRVMVADLSEERLGLARKMGADVYVNSRKENLKERVLEETNGAGADVVITACPSPEAQEEALGMVKTRGRISFFGGLPHDRSKINFDSNIVHYKEISIFGSFASYALQYKKALSLLASGRIKAEHFITHKFPLEKVEEGINMVKEGKALKAVVVME